MNEKLKPINTLPPFKKLCMTIGEIPTSYLESMSYYETLIWLCNYISKTLIPAINDNTEAIEELQSLYIELKNYVDNYFDNLDVQEEINNKLDEMAESGELVEIISQYLTLAGILSYNTINDLKSAENLIEGSICKTLGYNNYLDGFGQFYRIREIRVSDTIDNFNIVSLTNSDTLIAELIPDIFIKSFNTLDDLKNSNNLSNGEKINVIGENSINDGRGSLWYIRTKTNEDVENYNTIFLNNNLVGIRINNYCGKTTGKMYGIGDTATLSNINNTGIRAQIMGFHNDYELATYGNRDHVIQYKEFRTTQPNNYLITNVNETSVTLNENPTGVEIGSIIDLYPDNTFNKTSKYSGFVTNIDNNIIYVSHWYLYGNTSEGQIPTGVLYACIDMPTKVWVNNDNLILSSGSNVKEGVIAEYGLINEKYNSETNPTARANGIDIVGMNGKSDYGVQVRESGGDIDCGLLAMGCNQGILTRDCNFILRGENNNNEVIKINTYGGIEISTSQSSSNYMIRHNNRNLVINGDGYIQNQCLLIKEKAGNITLDTSECSFFHLTGSNQYTLDSGANGRLIYIRSRSALNNLVINGNTYGLQQGKTVALLSIGGAWVDINGVLF